MKHLFKSKTFKNILSLLILLLIVKLSWLVVTMFWLSSGSVEHEDEVGGKSLYYRVKLTPNEVSAPVNVPKAVQMAGSIKDISLLAIYNSSDTTVVTVEYKRKTKILGRGDTLNGFVLEGGGSNYATFTKDAKTYRVDLVKSKRSPSSRSSITPVSKSRSRSPDKPTGTPKVEGDVVDAGDHKIVDKSLIDHYASNMDDIYKNIGITEMKDGDKLKGFKITFVKRGSPFAKLGLKRGDIIKSINGEEINSYNAAFSTYKNIKDVENLSLVIIRDKKEMELEYEIN